MPISVYFENESKKSSNLDWQYEKTKRRYSTLIQKDYDNSAAQQIDSQEKLINEINRDPNRLLSIIFNMQMIYIEYFD